MNKASHKRKIKMARKMRTQQEMSHKLRIIGKGKNKQVVSDYKNIFDSKAWMDRKQAIADRVKRNIAKVKARKLVRLKKKGK